MKNIFCCISFLLFSGCLGVPKSVTPVRGFELNRYLGKWYEITRLDHPFERELEQVSTEYSLREDGGVRVKNRGFSPEKNEWREAEGKAFFAGDPNEGFKPGDAGVRGRGQRCRRCRMPRCRGQCRDRVSPRNQTSGFPGVGSFAFFCSLSWLKTSTIRNPSVLIL